MVQVYISYKAVYLVQRVWWKIDPLIAISAAPKYVIRAMQLKSILHKMSD